MKHGAWYAKLVVASSLCGAAMELFMIKTGFCVRDFHFFFLFLFVFGESLLTFPRLFVLIVVLCHAKGSPIFLCYSVEINAQLVIRNPESLVMENLQNSIVLRHFAISRLQKGKTWK
jgi:hypothetical protein